MKGILFKPWKIKFITEHPDMEIQTRRVIKPQPEWKEHNPPIFSTGWNWNSKKATLNGWKDVSEFCRELSKFCPYQVGETVYIKEAWYAERRFDHLKPRDIPLNSLIGYPLRDIRPDWAGKLRSPMFLREDFARLFHNILAVRAERLQEITEDAILAEGIRYPVTEEGHLILRLTGNHPPCDYIPKENFKNGAYAGSKELWLKAHFASLWNSINPKYSWEGNPWVYPYTFRLIAQNSEKPALVFGTSQSQREPEFSPK